jgi:hypothetical protein
MSASRESVSPDGAKARDIRKIPNTVASWCTSEYEYRWATKIQVPRANTNKDIRVNRPISAVRPAMAVTQ